MARATKRGMREALDFSSLAVASVKAGRPEEAVRHFARAISCAPRDPGLRLNQARLLARLGEADLAAQQMSTALTLKPVVPEAPGMLSRLAETQVIVSPLRLNQAGLVTALGAAGIDRQPLATLAFRIMVATGAAELPDGTADPAQDDDVTLHPISDFAAAVAAAPATAPDIARRLILKRTHPALQDPLLLTALSSAVNTEWSLERLLTAVRDVIATELDQERWEDPALSALALALARQLELNEYLWPTPDSAEKLDRPDLSAALGGDVAAALGLVRAALVHPMSEPVGGASNTPSDAQRVRPGAVREWLARHWLEAERYRTLSAQLGMTTFGDASRADDVSTRVAAQYETRPYPRWTTLRMPKPGSLREAILKRYAPDAHLPEDGYNVLIAGAGTGRHACQSAVGHGPASRVLAIDLSQASLRYGAGQAQSLGIANLSFASGNLLEVADLEQSFDVIESVGVLHHMADPLAGWKALVDVLKPGGVMWIALYSGTSRRNITRMRQRADFPGVSPDNETVRRFRRTIIEEQPDPGEPWVGNSIDTWSMSGFRDLIVHEHERPFSLPEISSFLDEAGLKFRGFTLHQQVIDQMLRASDGESWPGTLEAWAAYEAANPRLFDGMYSFWVQKSG